MTYYLIKVPGLNRNFRYQFEATDTISDLCSFIQEQLGTKSKFNVIMYGSSLQKTQSKLIDIAPEDSCFTLNPISSDPEYRFKYYLQDDIPDDKYCVFTTESLQSMIKGKLVDIDENQNVKKVEQKIRDEFGIDENLQIHLFLPGGCPFFSGTINDIKKVDELRNFRRHLYVIITNKIPKDVLNQEIINACDASSDEKKLLLSPCFESSISSLCTIASLLGYINQNGEDSDSLVYSLSRFFPFAPFVCALHQLQSRNLSCGRTIMQITAPLFTIMRDSLKDLSIEDSELLSFAPKFFTYLINFDIKGDMSCTTYTPPFLEISTEGYLKEIFETNHLKDQVVTFWDPDFRGIDWVYFEYLNPTKEKIDEACENISSLNIILPMDLRKIRRSTLFRGDKGPWLFLNGTYGKQKGGEDNIDIINPLEGKIMSVDPEDFASKIVLNADGSSSFDIVDPKQISQITYFIIDKSDSMFEEYKGTTRFLAAKQFLISFLDAAYTSLNFSLFGLIPFDNKYNIVCDLTILSPNFRDELEKVKSGGSTHIFKTMQAAAEKLVEVQDRYPNAVKRLIVLTDGMDNHADYTYVNYEGVEKRYFNLDISTVSNYLIDNKIRVDCMYVSDEVDARLYKLAKMTGGCAFYPSSIYEGLKIFSEEPFYNVLIRDFKPFSTERLNHDQIQSTPMPSPDDWDKTTPSKPSEIASLSNKNTLVSPKYIAIQNEGKILPARRKGRLLKELRNLAGIDCEKEGIRVYTFKDQIDKWRVLIRGPDGSLYKNRWFYLTIEFPANYPNVPPTIRFVHPPFHVNIGDNGFICMSNLDKNYMASDTVHDLLTMIIGLLMCPNNADPLDQTRIDMIKKGNEELFKQKVEEYNNKNSKLNPDEWIDGWNIENDPDADNVDFKLYAEADPQFKCNLTGKIMKEPVLASSGVYFERNALIQYIRNNKKAKCPITGKEFKNSDLNLPVDNNLKVKINKWYEEHGKKLD